MRGVLTLTLAIALTGLGPSAATAEGPNTIELPAPKKEVPLPEGWTRRQFVDRFIWLWSVTPQGLMKNQWPLAEKTVTFFAAISSLLQIDGRTLFSLSLVYWGSLGISRLLMGQD